MDEKFPMQPKRYDLSDPRELVRLRREVLEYMKVSVTHGSDHAGRAFAIEALQTLCDRDGAKGVPQAPANVQPAGEVSADQGDLYEQAVRIVTAKGHASISGVQRRLKIGYNRAARLIEEMEVRGVVGPLQPNGSRELLPAAGASVETPK
jgi:DNA segregation ATPase FtsK/SpoIIIE-like protein